MSAHLRVAWRRRIASVGSVVREESPLDYKGPKPHRFAIHDPEAKPTTHPYFDTAPDTVAFLDWSIDGGDTYIHFIATRDGYQRRGLARRLVEHLYADSDRDVNWGRIISDEAEALWRDIKEQYPDRWNKAKTW